MTSELVSLATLAGQGGDVDWRAYRETIERRIEDQPRSRQTRIGPSELGNPCDRCLVLKLAGVQSDSQRGQAWLPFIGTAVHAALADFFTAENAGRPHVRYLVESRVSIGTIGDDEITGSTDLFDLDTGTVVDWKIVGQTTLLSSKANGPIPQYRRQIHLYGYGLTRRGLTVKNVAIAFLPRNHVTLSAAYLWAEPYNEHIALRTIARARMFDSAIRAYGLDKVLADTPEHIGEHSCHRYGMPSRRDGFADTASLLGITPTKGTEQPCLPVL